MSSDMRNFTLKIWDKRGNLREELDLSEGPYESWKQGSPEAECIRWQIRQADKKGWRWNIAEKEG